MLNTSERLWEACLQNLGNGTLLASQPAGVPGQYEKARRELHGVAGHGDEGCRQIRGSRIELQVTRLCRWCKVACRSPDLHCLPPCGSVAPGAHVVYVHQSALTLTTLCPNTLFIRHKCLAEQESRSLLLWPACPGKSSDMIVFAVPQAGRILASGGAPYPCLCAAVRRCSCAVAAAQGAAGAGVAANRQQQQWCLEAVLGGSAALFQAAVHRAQIEYRHCRGRSLCYSANAASAILLSFYPEQLLTERLSLSEGCFASPA